MIGELSGKDLDSASFLYSRLVQSQNPPGHLTVEEAKQQLRKNFVHKRYHVFISKDSEVRKDIDTSSQVNGILIFRTFEKRAKIFFIGASPAGKGTGKALLRALGEFCLRKGIGIVQSVTSSVDERACSFYEHCGFKKIRRKQKEGFAEILMKADSERLKEM